MENTTNPHSLHVFGYRTILLSIYCIVLVCGTVCLSLTMHILKSSSTSITSIAVLNLIFAHFIFLVTVPFRIYYYATDKWTLGAGLCKVVSSMIHTHMYMSFMFCVVILIMRLMNFYLKSNQLASFNKIKAFLFSFMVWIVGLIVVPLTIHYCYGKKKDSPHDNGAVCFNFGKNIQDLDAKVFNYIVSSLIILVATVLMALQAHVVWVLHGRRRQGCSSQQDFGTQVKSLCFALIMFLCFVPYHVFRLYYLENIELQQINEVFLSVTTLNCLDMLTLLGKRTCYTCFY